MKNLKSSIKIQGNLQKDGSKQNKKTQVTKMSHENADNKRFKFLNSEYLANDSFIYNEDFFHTCDEKECVKPAHHKHNKLEN